MLREKIIKTISDYLNDCAVFALVYGSILKPSFNPQSDVDVAVYPKSYGSTFDDLLDLRSELSDLIQRDTDVIFLDKADIIVTMQALANRQLIVNHNKVILFGSHAFGTPEDSSDIDLYIITNDHFFPKNFDQKMSIKMQYAKALNPIRDKKALDIIVHTLPMHEKFKSLGSMFSKEILKQGIILYETDQSNSHV